MPEATRNLVDEFRNLNQIPYDRLRGDLRETKGVLEVKDIYSDDKEWKALSHEVKGVKTFYSKSYLKRKKFSSKLMRDLNLTPN